MGYIAGRVLKVENALVWILVLYAQDCLFEKAPDDRIAALSIILGD